MSLFWQSVLEKYLKLQDKPTVEKAYKKSTKYFENSTIQQNIRKSKELYGLSLEEIKSIESEHN